MTVSLTQRAQWAAQSAHKKPNVVLAIEGVGNYYGNIVIKRYATIGPSVTIDDPEINSDAIYIGGLQKIANQENAISINETTTSIRQMLQIDLGQGGSISTMSIALIDTGSITELITPGAILDDILQTRCKVYLGFDGLAFPDDYIVIFRGVVTDVSGDAGKVILTINHPDDKKKGSTFTQVQPVLNGAINSSVTTIPLVDASNILAPVLGPDGTYDPSFQSMIVIDDEIIRFTGISGSNLTGCTRGYLGTSAASHADQSDSQTFYRLLGSPLELALKIMASTGDGSNYIENALFPSYFVTVDGSPIANAIYFQNFNVIEQLNVQVGDYISVVNAAHPANNFSLKVIDDIVETSTGTYIVVAGVSLVAEDATLAIPPPFVSIRSQYDTLPDGLALTNDEIDIDEHIRLHDLFLSDVQMDIYVKDTVDDTRKFLETELYSPIACFSLPRKSRCSVGYHVGPIPGQDIKTFDSDNIKTPSKIKLTRSTNRQFYNEIVYKYDEAAKTTDFLSGIITISETSKAQIRGTDKTLTVASKGLRSTLNGAHIALVQSNARLKRYQFAAEVLSFGTLFGDGFDTEIGDIIWVDMSDLGIPDIRTGQKGLAGRYWFVQNKTLNFKNGDVQLECIDTHFNAIGRYGLISPASLISSGVSATQFVITASYAKKAGGAEHKKWANLIGAKLRIRNSDFSISAECNLLECTSNTIRVTPLPFTPSTGMVMELVLYDDQTLEKVNLTYAAMANADFPDGKTQFIML